MKHHQVEIRVQLSNGSFLTESDIDTEPDLATLRDWHEQVNSALVGIKGKLDAAMSNYFKSGERADEDWFRRARAAKRSFGFLSQKLQHRIKEVKDSITGETLVEQNRIWERAFVNNAKVALSETAFNKLVALTNLQVKKP